MSICEANKALSLKVKEFMLNVPDVKEESITDFLVWKWRELDKNFKYINVSTFSRQEESSTTGADFELELWLVGREFHLSLVFQAKKFVSPYDSYVDKLNYPKGTQTQLTTLRTYAKAQNKLPFYVFYSIPDSKTETMCGARDIADTAIFMAEADIVKEFADGVHGNRVSKNQILKLTNPFHCMFCCPLSRNGRYFAEYFSRLSGLAERQSNEKIPSYVQMLLSGRMQELGKKETLDVINKNELGAFRTVGVYDMRGFDD